MALIQITDLTFAYPGSFDNVFEHVSFQFDTDWRLALTGRNGRGKTTLLRLLQGQYPHQGTITAPRRVRVFSVSGSGRIAYAAGTAGAQLPGCAGMAFPAGTGSARGHRGRTVPLVFHAFRRRTGKASAGAAVRAGEPVFAHRRANESSGRDGPRARQPVSGEKVRFSARLA